MDDTSVEYYSIATGLSHTIESDIVGYGRCRKVNEFQKLNKIGEGTYGVVYRARDTITQQVVALKRMRVDEKTFGNYGISLSVLREVCLLKQFRHENVVRLLEVAVSRDLKGVFLVMEFCDQDLGVVLDHQAIPFTESQIKCLMQQLLRSVAYLHDNYIIHRDIKVSNMLLTNSGNLKLGDFGLARIFGDENMDMTPRVVTLWYRCPELLLGSKKQSPAVDIWACACVLGELFLHKPLLPGKTELDQIDRIIQLLGTPTPAIWPDLESMPALQNFTLKSQPYNNLKVVFEQSSLSAIDLLNELFSYDPKKRPSARQALKSSFFTEPPLPCDPALLPTLPDQSRRRKRKESTQ